MSPTLRRARILTDPVNQMLDTVDWSEWQLEPRIYDWSKGGRL